MIQRSINLFRASLLDYLSLVIFSFGIALLALFQIIAHDSYKFDVLTSSIILVSATVGQLLGSVFATLFCYSIQNVIAWLKWERICSMKVSGLILIFSLSILFAGIGVSASNVLTFSVLGFLVGTCLGLFSPINAAVLTNNINVEDVATANFLRRVMLNVGACLAFILTSLLVETPERLFYCVAFIFFVFGIVQVVTMRLSSERTGSYAISSKNLLLPKEALANKNILRWLLGSLICYIIFFQTISAYPVYLQSYAGVSAQEFSQYMILSTVIIFGFQFISPLLERKYSLNRLSIISAVLMTIGILLVALGHSDLFIIVSVLIWSVGEIFLLGVTPLYAKVFSDGCGKKNLSYNSAYYTVCYIGKLVGPVGGSLLLTISRPGYFMMLILLAVIASVLFSVINLKPQRVAV